MLKNLLLAAIIFIVWSSPDLRSAVARGLRETANWIEPKKIPKSNPKYLEIPNPFYKEDMKGKTK